MICRKCKEFIPDESLFCCFCGTAQQKTKKPSAHRSRGSGTVSHCNGRTKPWKALAPQDEKGNRPLLGYYTTKQEAIEALADYKAQGIRNEKLNLTFEELFAEWKDLNYRDISRQTQDNYNAAYRKLSSLCCMKVRDIRTANMQRIIDSNNDMSASTLSKIKALLTQLYDYAMQNDIVAKNYAKFVKLPHVGKSVKDCFNDVELLKIERAAADGVPFADCILMMCYTGFRIAEFLSLTPFSYKGGILTGGLKTDAGRNRAVPVHDKIKPYLLKWLDKHGETIICRSDGMPYSTKYFREKCYYPALDKIGTRKLSPHATRHTFATRLSAAGVKPEEIQKLMGHSNYDVTANVYIHKDLDALKSAVNML